IGKSEIPAQITLKTQPLTPAEESLFRTHPLVGSRLAQKLGPVPPAVIAIIEQHHECMDGSGYPRKTQGRWISQLVRVVAIANVYDNLCNPLDVEKALSPKDAMAHLFRAYAEKLDPDLVKTFISVMGVYPPGTVVQLSDDNIGLVVAVDRRQLLRPRVVLYN